MTQLPQPGDLIGGKYRVVRLLGEGGNGSVFEAENVLTEKRVAIKWLRAALSGVDDARARMLREAQSAARVNHRNVVDIYDAGFDEGVIFLVMELLEGETLADLLATRELPIADLIALLIPALRGVAAAHRRGVIHRDLKPENLFVAQDRENPEPHCVVLDFGVAKLSGSRSLTTPGYAVGTPIFMSIEQLVGDSEIDARSDVHAIGVILYVALTGRSPHAGDTLRDMAMQMLTVEPVPVHQLRPELPLLLCSTVGRAMAKERSKRPESMDELIAALTPFAAPAGEAWGNTRTHRTRLVPDDLGTPSLHGVPEPRRAEQGTASMRVTPPAATRAQTPYGNLPAQAITTPPARPTRAWWLLAVAALLGGVTALGLRAMLSPSAPQSRPLSSGPSPVHGDAGTVTSAPASAPVESSLARAGAARFDTRVEDAGVRLSQTPTTQQGPRAASAKAASAKEVSAKTASAKAASTKAASAKTASAKTASAKAAPDEAPIAREVIKAVERPEPRKPGAQAAAPSLRAEPAAPPSKNARELSVDEFAIED